MIDLKRILLPTDFSEYANTAQIYAVDLAKKFGAELHLVHISVDMLAMVPEPGMNFLPPGDYLRDMQNAAKEGLAKILPGDVVDGVKIIREVRLGTPFVEIVRYAKEANIDLIVIGTHGRTGLAHALMGSTAEKVVRKAPCPVLTVRPDAHQFVLP
ncbi:MAG: universal stress protein [Planctomycetaceae bacterium]